MAAVMLKILLLIALVASGCNQRAGGGMKDLASLSVPAVGRAQLEPTAAISMTVPARDDAEVGRQMTVEGSGALIPRESHLWAAVRREDFVGVTWPQNEARHDRATGRWSVDVVFGELRDVGHRFEISVFAVDEQIHDSLMEYRGSAMRTGIWLPVNMPPVVSALQGVRRVKKLSHD